MTDIAALLGQAQVLRALIVDDAYDETPLAMDLAVDFEEWTHFFEDLTDEDNAILREIYPAYVDTRADQLQSDDGFVSVLWHAADRLRPELLAPLFARYRSASETDLARLGSLNSPLTKSSPIDEVIAD